MWDELLKIIDDHLTDYIVCNKAIDIIELPMTNFDEIKARLAAVERRLDDQRREFEDQRREFEDQRREFEEQRRELDQQSQELQQQKIRADRKFAALDAITTEPFGLNIARQLCIVVHQSFGEDPLNAQVSYDRFLEVATSSINFLRTCLGLKDNVKRDLENLRISRNVSIHGLINLIKSVCSFTKHEESLETLGRSNPFAFAILLKSRPMLAQVCAAVTVTYIEQTVSAEDLSFDIPHYFNRCMKKLFKTASDSNLVTGFTLVDIKRIFHLYRKHKVDMRDFRHTQRRELVKTIEMIAEIPYDRDGLCPANPDAEILCRNSVALLACAQRLGQIPASGRLVHTAYRLSLVSRRAAHRLRSL